MTPYDFIPIVLFAILWRVAWRLDQERQSAEHPSASITPLLPGLCITFEVHPVPARCEIIQTKLLSEQTSLAQR